MLSVEWHRTGAVCAVFETVPPHLLHHLFYFAQRCQKAHLFCSITLADFGHRKSDVDQNPVADLWDVVFEQTQLNLAAHSRHFHDAYTIRTDNQFDNLARYG